VAGVFFVVGLPGSGALLLSIREPTRQGVPAKRAGNSAATVVVPPVSLGEVWSYLCGNRGTFTCLYLGVALAALNGYGAAAWIPTFFIRRHGWTAGDTGLVVGLIVDLWHPRNRD
jgi:hypothetical protein